MQARQIETSFKSRTGHFLNYYRGLGYWSLDPSPFDPRTPEENIIFTFKSYTTVNFLVVFLCCFQEIHRAAMNRRLIAVQQVGLVQA